MRGLVIALVWSRLVSLSRDTVIFGGDGRMEMSSHKRNEDEYFYCLIESGESVDGFIIGYEQ